MTIKSFWNSEYEQVTEFLQGRGGKITKTKKQEKNSNKTVSYSTYAHIQETNIWNNT